MFETLCKIEKIFIDILLVPSRHDNFSPRQSYYKNYYTFKKNNRDLSNIVMQIFFFLFRVITFTLITHADLSCY